jgi:hypothetical protein
LNLRRVLADRPYAIPVPGSPLPVMRGGELRALASPGLVMCWKTLSKS